MQIASSGCDWSKKEVDNLKVKTRLYFKNLSMLSGGSRKRPHPGSSRTRNVGTASAADYRGQQECGKTDPTTASMQPSSSYHPTDSCYQPAGAGRTGHDTSIDSQYGSSGSMDHPYGDHTHGHPDQHSVPPIQANYTSSPYLYRDNAGVHHTPPHKHHKGLPYSDLNRMSPIPEVSYNPPNSRNRQASDTVVWSSRTPTIMM